MQSVVVCERDELVQWKSPEVVTAKICVDWMYSAAKNAVISRTAEFPIAIIKL